MSTSKTARKMTSLDNLYAIPGNKKNPPLPVRDFGIVFIEKVLARLQNP
jgi:hypothetical protein